ncbi:XRE family transcriptional regulator [Enterococcus sp. BWR-S5]|uniref:XRE family transcriptional regulator n=1 Tax=Enterococcus sp. BWR-S5 TaxID=2787714 RepID=UPI0019232D2B|nr:XRE family transcriptional regulator [Enterococcus sp. BWR-S5]MBL1223710.1 XRE family transcriptional regulator [Enterococcus sp. BWR-S5]
MPETLVAREKIQNYLNENNISISDLAVMYNIKKQDLADYLAGRKSNPRGNKLILRIISDYKIR